MGQQRIESVGIREFRANLHKYTSGLGNPIAVTSHGERIGFYIPLKTSPQEKDFEALRQASLKFNEMLEQNGISPDEIIQRFKEERALNSNHAP